jgi:hypothetical protein
MKFGLRFLNDYAYDTNENTYLALPEILDERDTLAKEFFPYRNFLAK